MKAVHLLLTGNDRTSIKAGSQDFEKRFRLLRFLFVCALFTVYIAPSWALAQSAAQPWDAPLNLSRSGVAMNPAIVSDSDGSVHAVWQDDLANYWYTQWDGSQWGSPEATDLNLLFRLPPAGETPDPDQLANHAGPNPLFIAGPNQMIFAFWITPEGNIFTSKVENQSFKTGAAWDSGRVIAAGAASFAAALDAQGDAHLAFLRTADDPANPPGIYYTRSTGNGQSWSTPTRLYESPYLRRLGEGEANLSLAPIGTGSTQHVYVTWDNRPRKQVLLAQSKDGGENWEQPELIAGPTPDSGLAGPFNIQVSGLQNSVVLIWQHGQPGGICSQIFQFSGDAGRTWSNPQPMIEDLLGCARSNDFVTGLTTNPRVPPRLFLLTKTQNQVFLTGWNGVQWSQPRSEPVLSGFEDPETYAEVLYGCHRASLSGDRLYILGCDEGGGGDVWVTSRDLGPPADWFTPPIWSPPSPVAEDALEVETLELVATEDNLIHAFFSQRQAPFIFHTRWDGELWSPIAPVLEMPEGEAGGPAVAAGPDNELFLIAPSNEGGLYYSQATSNLTITASSWSAPMQLEVGHDGEVGAVDVAWDAAGTVYVVYSVPVNEERGIYLVQSRDDGTSWSAPLQVFDGAAGGFDLVGAPSLLISGNGSLHILWKEQSIEGDGLLQPLALYYVRSEDGGRTFSDADRIVEEPVGWREMVIDGAGNLHVLWQPPSVITTVWDQVSLDGGHSWQIPLGIPNEGTSASIVVDSSGRLHLADASLGSLGHWLWDGDTWQPEATLYWASAPEQETPVDLVASIANKQGKMVVLMGAETGIGDGAARTLLYSSRTLELPLDQAPNDQAPTQTVLAPTAPPTTATPVSVSSPTSTMESEPTTAQSETDQNETSAGVSPFALALLPVALLLLGVLGLVIRRITRVGDR